MCLQHGLNCVDILSQMHRTSHNLWVYRQRFEDVQFIREITLQQTISLEIKVKSQIDLISSY